MISPTAVPARAARRRLGRTTGLCATIALVAGLLAVPAVASAKSPPHYSLSIVEGESTLPESRSRTPAGNVSGNAEVVVSIIRGGTVVAQVRGKRRRMAVAGTAGR